MLPEEWAWVADGLVTLRPDAVRDRRVELALVRLLRVLAHTEDEVTIALGADQVGGAFDPADLAALCRMVRPGLALRMREGRTLVAPVPTHAVAPVASRMPSRALGTLAAEVFGPYRVEWATYSDAVVAEHLGVPIVGERDGELVVGIDPRDQVMASRAGVVLEEQARHLLGIVRASRAGQRARIDLSRWGVGRWLRAEADEGLVRFEIGPLGRSPDRAFARHDGMLHGFASGTNLLVVLEAALLAARVPELEGVTFVLEGGPHPLLGELGRLLGMQARFESRRPLDGR